MARFWDLMQRIKASRIAFWPLMIANLAGIVGGYYYYWQVGQFHPGDPEFRAYGWWPFISDSPNAVLLMSASLVLYRFGRRRSALLDSLAFVHMVYVGVWTTTLFLLYPERMHTFDWSSIPHNANPVLFVSHMGMPLEALLLVPDLRRDVVRWGSVAAQAAWHAGNVWLDYGPVLLHPAPFLHPDDHVLHMVSPLLMTGTLVAWLLVLRPWRPRPAASPSPGSNVGGSG